MSEVREDSDGTSVGPGWGGIGATRPTGATKHAGG
jgi:hypothetical protein